jgi:hypothetical protein
MPNRAPLGCPAPRCPNLQPCPDHPASWAQGQRGRRMPPGWTATAARILRRDPVCRLCWLAPSAEVHHTRPGVEDDAWLLGVCSPCHLQVTLAQAALARRLAQP